MASWQLSSINTFLSFVTAPLFYALKSRILYLAFVVVLVVITAFFVYLCQSVTVITLYDETGRERYRFILATDERFTVRFLHSWARSPVDEVFQIDKDNNIVLKETVYEDFGAGLPHEPENPLSSITVENGKIYIRNIDRIVSDLQIRTGRFVAEHALLYRDKRIMFSDIVAPGNVVLFKVQSINRYYALYHLDGRLSYDRSRETN